MENKAEEQKYANNPKHFLSTLKKLGICIENLLTDMTEWKSSDPISSMISPEKYVTFGERTETTYANFGPLIIVENGNIPRTVRIFTNRGDRHDISFDNFKKT